VATLLAPLPPDASCRHVYDEVNRRREASSTISGSETPLRHGVRATRETQLAYGSLRSSTGVLQLRPGLNGR
jgi:hypothetical protein